MKVNWILKIDPLVWMVWIKAKVIELIPSFYYFFLYSLVYNRCNILILDLAEPALKIKLHIKKYYYYYYFIWPEWSQLTAFCSHASSLNTKQYSVSACKSSLLLLKACKESLESTICTSHFALLGQPFILHDRILFQSNTDDKMNVVHSAEVARAKCGNTSSPSP